MALTFADIFGPVKDLIDRHRLAVASTLTARTAQYAYPSSGSAVSTPEYQSLTTFGSGFYEGEIGALASIQDGATGTAAASWIPFMVRYLKDNDTLYESSTAELGSALRALLQAMITDDEDLDACTPTAGTVAYDTQNQGDGTATIAINAATTTLAELALAGTIRLRCISAGYSVQNEERWALEWVGTNPRTGDQMVRRSASRNFKTGIRYFDVAATEYPAAGVCPLDVHQIPQRGGSIHTGLNILISIPTYSSVTESGDPSTCFAAYSFTTISGTKTNVSNRNTELLVSDNTRKIYLRAVDLTGSWSLRLYSDAGLTNPISEALTFTEGSGDATISFITSAPGTSGFSTNGEHVSNGGHLTTGSIFMQCTIDDSAITAEVSDFTVTLTVNLPFRVGDLISCPITNSYAGILSRFFVEEFGFALRTIADTSESIADPA